LLYSIVQFIIDKIPESIADTFARLYEEYMPKVFRYINYRVLDVDTAQDITENAFEKALINFEAYSSNRAEFSTWIFTIAKNTLIDYYRSSARENSKQKGADIQVKNHKGMNLDYQVIETEEMNTLQSYIAQLSAQEKEIISLKFGAEMTNRKIAKMLGLSESNVGTIVYRTVCKLRDKYREETR
jgi:RNA polymerase sigma factor (sigma-70 family)